MLAQLEADRTRVVELQIQILHLERTLSDLRFEHSQAQGRLDSYTYPVLTLPTEIVSEIFVRVLPPSPDFPRLFGPSSPTVLAQVCARWRGIALSTPQLWSAISSFDDCHAHRELRIFKLWLQRSRLCPLSIRLGTGAAWANGKSVDAVVPHRARWEYLQINLRAENLGLFDGPMPLLQHLEFMVDSGLDLLTDFSLHGMPVLRTLILHNVDALQVTFPWTQLTSLTFPGVNPFQCLPILMQTPNLVHCKLRVHPHGGAEPRPGIALPSLESLILTRADLGHSATDFLQNFVAPGLRRLEVSQSFLAPNPIASLEALIPKSSCRLEELHLTDAISGPENSESYRQVFPSLRKLSFNGIVIDDGENSMHSDSDSAG
ncbi:hypothetical protein DFH06DRAFT_1230588 [Mycena polygramma]|nr:hypothetical protein DFH06DRAFT_1230588 [Mycena polygramma]